MNKERMREKEREISLILYSTRLICLSNKVLPDIITINYNYSLNKTMRRRMVLRIFENN